MKRKKQISEAPISEELQDSLDWYTIKLTELAQDLHLYLYMSRPRLFMGAVMTAAFKKAPYTDEHEDMRVFQIDLRQRDIAERYYTVSRIADIIDNWLHAATYK